MPLYSLGERRVTFGGNEWYVANTAAVIGSVFLGHQSSVWFNVVIRGDSENIIIGERSNVQDGSVLHADPGRPLSIGSDVTIGHKVMLHGCSIGDGTLIGINSVLLNGCVVGGGTLIGANTLIPEGKNIPEGVLVLGQPGKIVRELTPAERQDVRAAADLYVKRARVFSENLKPQPS